MDENNALQRLLEAADLIKMIEELTGPTDLHKLPAGTMAGLRITLKNVREAIVTSHQHLSKKGPEVEKESAVTPAPAAQPAPQQEIRSDRAPDYRLSEPHQEPRPAEVRSEARVECVNLLDNATSALRHQNLTGSFQRRDLRASLEKIGERF